MLYCYRKLINTRVVFKQQQFPRFNFRLTANFRISWVISFFFFFLSLTLSQLETSVHSPASIFLLLTFRGQKNCSLSCYEETKWPPLSRLSHGGNRTDLKSAETGDSFCKHETFSYWTFLHINNSSIFFPFLTCWWLGLEDTEHLLLYTSRGTSYYYRNDELDPEHSELKSID